MSPKNANFNFRMTEAQNGIIAQMPGQLPQYFPDIASAMAAFDAQVVTFKGTARTAFTPTEPTAPTAPTE